MYYLPDKQGNLQPVLHFKYQDFVDLYKLKNQLEQRDQPPSYSIQRITVTGTAGAEHALLTIQIQVLVHDEDWVRIPLRLDQGVLRGVGQYRGAGEQFLHYEGEGQGYVCWVRGKPDSQHDLTLTMFVPLSIAGDETRLKLATPRALASELKLSVPMPDAVGTVSEGATLLPPAANNSGATEFDVVGLGGDFQLTWHKVNPRAVETPVVLEAAATVLARLDGHSITAEATLSVRSYGAPFERFSVRLPPEMELVAGNPNGYLITPLEASAAPSDRRRLVEVRFPKKTAGPVEVRLACRRDYDPVKSQAWSELAGFEVVGAARQWGTVAVAAGDEWQVLWGTSRGTRQIDQLPDALRKENVVAGFEYVAEPFSLPARLVPRKTRISVDPKYVLLVDRDQVRLEGRLGYTVRGARVTALEVAIPGWELDEVGPDSLVAVDGVTVNSGTLSIPLVQPSSGSMELQLRAHRAIEAGATSLAVPLPQPRTSTVGAASVAVVAADNVELTPNNQAIEGLVRQRSAPPMRLPERQQEPLYYHGTGGVALFAADFRACAQQITVDASTQVTLAEQAAAVEQKFSYSVAYEPVGRLTLAVPRTLASGRRIRVLYDGKAIVPVVAADDSVGKDATAPVSMRVTLPDPHIGSFDLTLQYSVPAAEPRPDEPAPISIPLPMPLDGQLVSNGLLVRAARNTSVSPREGGWTVVDRDSTAFGSRGILQLTAADRTDRVALDLRWGGDDTGETTTVDRAWIQCWLTSPERQDLAVYQFTTGRKEWEVTLPTGAVAGQTAVSVNGKPAEPRVLGDQRLSIPLPGQGEPHRFVVELRYRFLGPRPPRGALDLEFPNLGHDVWVRRMYWQLVLPANEHLIADPSGFTGEFTWGWQGYYWGRQPLLDQTQLESWSGAAPRPPLPDRANVYLFSTLGNVEQAELRTASRTWIVLWASGAALVAGLLLIYVPASRHPAALLAVAIALLAAGLIAPEPTLLLGQGASLGLVLTLLAGLLERGVSGRRKILVQREPSSSLVEVASTHTAYRPSLAASQTLTATAPVIPPESPRKVE